MFSFNLLLRNFRLICPKFLLLKLLLWLSITILFLMPGLLLIGLDLFLFLLKFTNPFLFFMLSVYGFLSVTALLVTICTSFASIILVNDDFLIVLFNHFTLKLARGLNVLNKFFFNYYVDLGK